MSHRGHQLLYRVSQAAARRAGAVPDADLVRHVARDRDRAAFELLLWRHGPAIWGVCRRVLGPTPDAEDVFQAVFLTLARRAGSIADGNAVPGWLHRVAVRTAVEARNARMRRLAREAVTPHLPEPVAPEDPVRTAAGHELGAVLDEEIARLPDRFRLPFLLCEVYGRCPTAAAEELRCPVGTVASRLSRAKGQLRARLARRGVTLPATVAATAVPSWLPVAALRAAFAPAAVVPAGILTLAHRAARPAPVGPWAMAAAIACVATLSAVLLARQPKTPPTDKLPPEELPAAAFKVKDSLPDGAVARVGSQRLRHADGVNDVTFSPDGKWIATAGKDGTARVWDANTGALQYRFPANPGTQARVAFLDDALWVFSPRDYATLKADLRRFRLADGKELPRVLPDADRANLLQFGFDRTGARFGYVRQTGMNENGAIAEVQVMDVRTLKPVAVVPYTGQLGPVFSAGGKLVALSPSDGAGAGASMPVFDVDTGKKVVTITDPDRTIGAADFSADGKFLATVGRKPNDWENMVAVWDARTGNLVRRITGVEITASCVAFSPDGRHLAVGTIQRMAVQLFDVASGKEVRRFRSWPGAFALAFSADGKQLAAARSIGTASVWDVETGKPTAASADPGAFVLELRFAGPGRLLVVSDDAVLYDWQTGKVVERSAEPRGPANDHYAVSPDRGLLAVPTWTGEIRLYDARTGAEVRQLKGHTSLAEPVQFSADGTRLFSRGHDQTVGVWDVATGKRLHRFDFGSAMSGDQLAVSPDGRWVAASHHAGEGMAVQVWDATTGREGPRFTLEKGQVGRLAFGDGATLAAVGGANWFDGDQPGWAVLWDVASGAVRRTLTGPKGFWHSVAISPDGRSVATAGHDATIRIWEVATGQERRAFRGHQGAPYQLVFSPDGRHLASSSTDDPALVWDVCGTPAGGLTEAERKTILADLAADAPTAFAAVRRLVGRPEEADRQLRALQLSPAVDRKKVNELIRALDADRFAVREKASAELGKLGDEVEPALRAALAAKPTAEAQSRLTILLKNAGGSSLDRLRELRAVEALERAGTADAIALLEAWARDSTRRVSPDAAAARDRLRGQ
jgi:RNA polymerase sigma factor (sigma-70 family)